VHRLRRSRKGARFAARLALAHSFGSLALTSVVSFTVVENSCSRAVIERLKMRRDPEEDFDHPGLPAGHPYRRHVLHRLNPISYYSPDGLPLFVKGSRTPAARAVPHTRAAGVREASGEETAGQVRSVVPRAMGIVSLALVARCAGPAWCGPREGSRRGGQSGRRGSMRRHACRDETREDTPIRR